MPTSYGRTREILGDSLSFPAIERNSGLTRILPRRDGGERGAGPAAESLTLMASPVPRGHEIRPVRLSGLQFPSGSEALLPWACCAPVARRIFALTVKKPEQPSAAPRVPITTRTPYAFIRPAPGRIIAALFLATSAMLTTIGCNRSTDAPTSVDDSDPRVGGRLYSATSPFNQAIPANPQLDPRSAAYVQLLNRSRNEKGFSLALGEWTVTAYFAEQDTPRHDVRISNGISGTAHARNSVHDVRWIMRGVPIPDNARPDPEEDAHLSVIDPATHCEYDLFGAAKTTNGWTAKWANVNSTTDNGIYPYGMSTRATGFAPLAGIIWPAELRNRRINHALVFAYPYTRTGGPVPPATSSDGRTTLTAALPQGARVQLDPTLNLDTLNLTTNERTIAEALQRYGMYLGDTGGALAIYAVNPQSFTTNPYTGLLPDEPSIALKKIPVNRFRVLKTGTQLARTKYAIVPSNCAQIDGTLRP
jgi:hypothetical protein